jgi:choline dehydrogenase
MAVDILKPVSPDMSANRAESGEPIRVNQDRLDQDLHQEFDFVVCGAGTSGSVIAGRLAANPAVRVLLLEAGFSDESDLVMDPNVWLRALGSQLDGSFTVEANPRLNGRAIHYSMGKVLGGGSSINVSTWSRGHWADWDFYAVETGDPSWVMTPCSNCIAAASRHIAGAPNQITEARTGRCMCSPRRRPTRFPWLCLTAPNR